MLSCDSPQEPLHFLGQTPLLEGDKLGSCRYTHSAFEHLKYSSTPLNTWMEGILTLLDSIQIQPVVSCFVNFKVGLQIIKNKTYWYPMGKSLCLQSDISVSIPKQSMVMEPAMTVVISAITRNYK